MLYEVVAGGNIFSYTYMASAHMFFIPGWL